VKTRFIYAGWQRIADYDGISGALQNGYVYGVGLDEPLIIVSAGGAVTFLHADKLGSIVATSDNTGAVTNKNKFGPFGELAFLGGTTFGFTGQRYDADLGLYYFKRRYLAASLGRFLQPDPIGYEGGDFNLYTYVKNSPLKFTDPMGLQVCSEPFEDFITALLAILGLAALAAALAAIAAGGTGLAILGLTLGGLGLVGAALGNHAGAFR
jgi:RHS repeat-associated protein